MANGKCRTAKRNIVDYLKNLCADVLPSGYFRFMMIMFCVRFLCSPVSSFSFIFNKRITWRHPQVFSSLFFYPQLTFLSALCLLPLPLPHSSCIIINIIWFILYFLFTFLCIHLPSQKIVACVF